MKTVHPYNGIQRSHLNDVMKEYFMTYKDILNTLLSDKTDYKPVLTV